MTKLSSTISYRLLRRWDHFLRQLSPVARYEIWSDASGKGYGGHLGPQSKPLDVWQDKHQLLSGGKGSTEYIEARALLLSLEKWGSGLKGKKVWCYIDNYQVYQILRRKYDPVDLLRPGLGLGLGWKRFYFTSNNTGNSMWLSSTFIGDLTSTNYEQSSSSSSSSSTYQNRNRGASTTKARCRKVTQTFEEIDELINKYEITIKARWVWGKDNFLADKLSRLVDVNGNSHGRGKRSLTPHVLSLLEAATTPSRNLTTEGEGEGEMEMIGERNRDETGLI
ncbi:hypothetical protein V865_002915 [Kwoniella europaea PYCC6329]|uniref:RNase H type-1 domain-containing protein n=1 Tax=Kwoniella europaea PYCC6329 TaxID=1423913 RepID=A0AAX4KFR1_9TREE